jgi:hypothetical protein
LYLFLGGIVALFVAPFLPWYYYGPNLDFPPVASLVSLYPPFFAPMLYFVGVFAAIIVAAFAKRPFFFLGILPSIFPLFVVIALGVQSYLPHLLIYRVFTAFLGCILLEASYFSYRHKNAGRKKLSSTIPNNSTPFEEGSRN